MKSSGIGGQAVIEGVMMRNQELYAVAVRTPEGKIEVKKDTSKSLQMKNPLFRVPLLRGIAAFIDSMYIGMKSLTYSSSFYEEEEEERESKLEKGLGKLFKEKAEAVLMALTVVLSVLLAVGIFMVLPFFLAGLAEQVTDKEWHLAVLEGVLRMLIFFLYLFVISRLRDIQRVFMYHGAEHKTINCVERGIPLTIENVKRQSRYHKRCGTSFMFLVIFLSVIFFIFLRFDNVWVRLASRIFLVPIIAGTAYELIRLAGNSDRLLIRILSRPGMWFQSLTTREPEEAMIEVAIASVEAVFDWKKYQEELLEEGDLGSDGVRLVDLDVQIEKETKACHELEAEALLREVQAEEAAVKEGAAKVTKPIASASKNTYDISPEEALSQGKEIILEGDGERTAKNAENTDILNDAPKKKPGKPEEALGKASENRSEAAQIQKRENERWAVVMSAKRNKRAFPKENEIHLPEERLQKTELEPDAKVISYSDTADTVRQRKNAKAEAAVDETTPIKDVTGEQKNAGSVTTVLKAQHKQEAAKIRKKREQGSQSASVPHPQDKKSGNGAHPGVDTQYPPVNLLSEEDDDDILRALDKYFVFHEEEKN